MIDDRITVTIFYDLIGATYAGEHRNPGEVLKELGIRYDPRGWHPQPMADQIKITGVDPLSIPELPPIFLRVHPQIPLDTEDEK